MLELKSLKERDYLSERKLDYLSERKLEHLESNTRSNSAIS